MMTPMEKEILYLWDDPLFQSTIRVSIHPNGMTVKNDLTEDGAIYFSHESARNLAACIRAFLDEAPPEENEK